MYCFLQLADLLYIGSVIQIVMNYRVFCTCHKESETKISKLPLSLLISAFQKSPVYFFLLIFHILFKEPVVAGFCACVLTQLSFFLKSLLWYTQCSHFTRPRVFVQQYYGPLSKELWKEGPVSTTAAEGAGKSK